jgi:hypothetical protein
VRRGRGLVDWVASHPRTCAFLLVYLAVVSTMNLLLEIL